MTRRFQAARGLTLAEMLVSLLALGLVAALAFSLTWTARRLFDRQSAWADGLAPAGEGLEMLLQDLAGSLVPESGEAPFFQMDDAPSGGARLRLVTAGPPEAADPPLPLSRFRTWRVVWQLEADAGGAALVRTARPALGSGETPATRFRIAGATGFSLEAYDPARRAWTTRWQTGSGGALPAAVRAALTVRAGPREETLRVETVIPAGLRIGGL